MKNTFLFIGLLGLAACQSAPNLPTHTAAPIADNHRFIVYYDNAVGAENVVRALQKQGVKIISQGSVIQFIAVQVPNSRPVEQSVKMLEQTQGVLGVNPDSVMTIQ